MAEIKSAIHVNVGGGGSASRFGIEDNTSDVYRSVDFDFNTGLSVDRMSDFTLQARSEDFSSYAYIYGDKSGTIEIKSESTQRNAGLLADGINGQSKFYAFADDAPIGQIKHAGIALDPLFETTNPGNGRFIAEFFAEKNDGGMGNDFSALRVPYVQGIHYLPTSVNGNFADSSGNITVSAGGSASRFGVSGEDDTSSVNRTVDMAGHSLSIASGSSVSFMSGDWATRFGNLYVGEYNSSLTNSDSSESATATVQVNNDGIIRVTGNYPSSVQNEVRVESTGIIIEQRTAATTYNSFTFPNTAATGEVVDRVIPISVNGNYADASGNITISGGGGSASRFGVAGEDDSNTTDRYIDMGGHGMVIDNTSNFAAYSGGIGGAYGGVYIGLGFAELQVQGSSGNDYSFIGMTPGELTVNLTADGSSLNSQLHMYHDRFEFKRLDNGGATTVIVKFINLPTYSSNATALAALGADVIYRDGDYLKISH